MLPSASSLDRRSRHRYPVALPVRVFIETSSLRRRQPVADTGERLAFGFVTAARDVGLVRGHVVRRAPGHGLAVIIDSANGAFDELLGRLAVSDRAAA